MKRILILTDSLGCPRPEIKVRQTWTDKLLSAYCGTDIVFYTYCIRGLASNDIPFTYIEDLCPDIIICQVGIVDACRRAMSLREQRIISKIPLFRRCVRIITKKYHYQLTKARNIHYVKVNDYVRNMKRVEAYCQRAIFIGIIGPGEFLVRRTWNVERDVKEYNDALRDAIDNSRSDMLTAFSDELLNEDVNKYLLAEDGHHLNPDGNMQLFLLVKRKLDNVLKEDEELKKMQIANAGY